MDYMKDYEGVRERLLHFLHGEPLDRCCIAVTAPRDAAHPYREVREGSESWYMDAERILKRNLERFEKTYFAGDAFPVIFPYFGTGGHAKYFRNDIDVRYGTDTIWIFSYLNSCRDLQKADVPNSVFFRKELAIMQYLVDEARGRYLVGMPDNCGSYDALAQLRGNEPLLCDLYDDPEGVQYAAGLVCDCLEDATNRMFDVVRPNNMGGSCHSWMNIMSDGTFMQLQCDMSVMLSPRMYGEFIMPELERTLEFLDGAFYHIDGQEQVRHLDMLLTLEKVKLFQWVCVEGQPNVANFIPVLQKIQKAGKGVAIGITKKDLKPLLEALDPNRTLLILGADSPEEADDIVRYAYEYTHEKCLKNV